LPKGNFGAFIDSLNAYGKVFAPVMGDKSCSFKEIANAQEMDLQAQRTMIPPKKLFLKLREKMFTYDERTGRYEETAGYEKKVIFGVHPCDIHAMKLIDKIYLGEPPDRYYRARRENSIIVGHSCHPDQHCFCQSLGTGYAFEGFDVFLHELEDGYFVRVGSDKGSAVMNASSGLLKTADDRDVRLFMEAERKREGEFTLRLEVNGLADMLSLAYEGDVWNEYADKCFGCGSCNLVCPTCRCYDVNDSVNLDLRSGERSRTLNSCMLRKHGKVAGGLNFRPTRVERLRNRFNCKGSFREELMNCVGCGRCTVYCPSKIDYVEVLRKVRGDI
jgi:sulfhydrogenase subunit beta (sulfur reductase)